MKIKKIAEEFATVAAYATAFAASFQLFPSVDKPVARLASAVALGAVVSIISDALTRPATR